MTRYEITRKALEDLNSIWRYSVKNWSEKKADEYYGWIVRCFQKIALNPQMGKYYGDIRSGLYGIRVKRHIIFYRLSENSPVEIVRILHGRMDLKNNFKQ